MRIIQEITNNIKRFRTAGLLNVLGLAVAFAALTVILMQLVFQQGYDKFHKDADRIYRVETLYPTTLEYSAVSPAALGAVLKERNPLIEDYFITTYYSQGVFLLKKNNGMTDKYQELTARVTAPFIDILGIETVEGDAKQALSDPNTILIPESIAGKWFGKETAIGKQVAIEGGISYTVAAVYRDFPQNSIFKNSCYLSLKETDDWSGWGEQLFVKGRTSDPDIMQQQVSGLKLEEMDQIFEMLHKQEQLAKEGKGYLRMSPLTGIFYDNTAAYDMVDKGNRRNAAVMLAVGVLIILIAGINFVNFSISQAPSRMKGINTQKVLGAAVGRLRWNLIGESVLYSFIAFLLSVGIVQLFALTSLAGLFAVSVQPFAHEGLLAGVSVFSIFLGILSGIYPAFYVTSFEPALVLKGSFVMSPKGVRLRNGLMAFQFVISIVLITCTLLVHSQYRFIQDYNVGFKTENVGCLWLDDQLKSRPEILINEIAAVPGVTGYTFADNVMGQDMFTGVGTVFDGEAIQVNIWWAHPNFLDFFDIPLVKGDNFSKSGIGEPQVIMNQMALKTLPAIENYMGRNLPENFVNARLIGIANDVHYMSLRKPVAPLAIICAPATRYNVMFLKLEGADITRTLQQIRKVYDRLSPDGMFQFKFLDESLQKNYEGEKRLMEIISLMGAIAILLALVGIYGLIVFNTQYKRKEIGIRKVNGARESQIIVLLNRDFFWLLLVSFVVACPLAWFLISRWLEGFAYKTEIHWWIFLLAGSATFLISLLTVSWQSWKASTTNPVDSLKNE